MANPGGFAQGPSRDTLLLSESIRDVLGRGPRAWGHLGPYAVATFDSPRSPSPGSPNSPWAWSGMCPSSPYMCINSRFPGSYGDCLVSSRGSNIDCLRKLGLFMAALPSGSETWVLPVCPPTAGRVGHRGAEQTPVGESVPKEKSSDTFLQNGNTYAITS